MRPSPVIVAPDMPGVPCSIFPKGLIYHFFLTNQLIDDKADALSTDGQDYHMPLTLFFMCCRVDQPALEVKQRQGLVAHDNHFLAIDHIGARQVEVENLIDVDQREGKRLVPQHHHQGRHDRQGQRHLDDDLGALGPWPSKC